MALMTTTLRPTEPLQHGPDGALSRSYQVCVNSRPVGALHLCTSERGGTGTGQILGLRVDEPDRRRGRATVALLAAEEIFRGWGCRHAELTAPAGASAALRLAAALGYTERSRHLRKKLPGRAPALPPGSHGRRMTGAEFGPWLTHARDSYAQTWIDRGVPEDQARERSARDHADAFPAGVDSPGNRLWVLEHEGVRTGTIWVTDRETDVYVMDVETAREHRGRGHGRSLMRLAEADGLSEGHRDIELNVLTGNTPALRLYESLDYRPHSHHFVKHLD